MRRHCHSPSANLCLPPTPAPPTPTPPTPKNNHLHSRYDYEGVESDKADAMMAHVRQVIASSPPGTKFGAFELQLAGEGEAPPRGGCRRGGGHLG